MNRVLVRAVWSMLAVFAALFLLIALVAIIDLEYLADVSKYLEGLSAVVAVADDLIVRIAGVAILVAGVTGYIYNLVNRLDDPNKPDWAGEIFKIAGLGAAMGLGGAAFFAGYVLDENDKAAEALLASPPVASVKILARWAQVVPAEGSGCVSPGGGETKNCPAEFSVRAVLASGDRCSDVSIEQAGSAWVPMEERRFTKPNGYLAFRSIRVCEKRISTGTGQGFIEFNDKEGIEVSDRWAGDPADGPRRIIVLGDTGCRDKWDDKKQDGQICDAANWPFERVAAAAAGDNPDLVLHVGDYMYIDVDGWSAWQTAFFEPAEPLLKAAPWVMVRGNHERCGKFGQAPHGYYLFFGFGDVEACKDDGELSASYALDLSQDHRLIVADSATAFAFNVQKALTASNGGEGDSSQNENIFGGIDQLAKEAGPGAKTVWLTTHVPVFALEKCEVSSEDIEKKLKKNETKCINSSNALFEADSPESSAKMYADWQGAPVAGVDAIISGDRHVFQLVKPPGNPLQVTVGTGGVNLDPAPLTQEGDHSCLSTDTELNSLDDANVSGPLKSWKHCSNESWGYAVAERNGRDFEFKFEPVTP